MALSRGIVLAVAYLVALPVLTVAADLAQRDAEAVSLSGVPLHQGETYRYDLTALADFGLMAATAEEVLELRFEATHESSRDDRHVLLIETERGKSPWDAATRESQFGFKPPLKAEFMEKSKEIVDVEDGRVLAHETYFSDTQWLRDGDGATIHKWSGGRWHEHAQGGALAPKLADWFGTEASYRSGWDTDAEQVNPPAGQYTLRASLDGRTVYGRSEQTVYHHAPGETTFGCPMDIPPFPYEDQAAASRWSRSPFTVTVDRTIWRAPDIALPVLVDCHATFVARHDNGTTEDIGHTHLIAHLAEHEPGHDAIDMAWNRIPNGPKGDATPKPAVVVGVPPDGNAAAVFRFPLSDAWDVVSRSEDERITSFRSAGSLPFALIEAYHMPGKVQSACTRSETLGIPMLAEECSFVAASTGADVGWVEPVWWMLLQNGRGERLTVQVMRNMTVQGTVLEDWVNSVASAGAAAAARTVPFDALPDHLVPVHDQYADWLRTQGLDNTTWQDSPHAGFHYRLHADHSVYKTEKASALPRYTGIYTFYMGEDEQQQQDDAGPFAKHGRFYGEEEAVTWYHSFRGSDGALVEHGTDKSRAEHESSAPIVRPSLQGTQWAPVRDDHVPIAAGVAAVAVTATFVGLWQGDWVRRRFALLAAPLFTKLSRDQVLEHRTRDEMIQFVGGNPGVGTEDIRRHLGIGWGTAVYHLSALEQNGILTSLKSGGHRHWFPTKALDADTKQAMATLRSTASKRLYEAIRAEPGRTQQELAAVLGVTHGAVIFQVRKLERAGLIAKSRDGRFVRYFPTETRGADGRPRA